MRSRKTDTETRAAVHPFLAHILQQETKKTVGYVMPKLAKLYLSGRSGRIKISTMISDLFESIGINTKYVEDGKRARSDCGFHSLRHTFVTMLRAGGATLQTAKAMAGHHTERMTEHYTHEDGSAALAQPDITKAQRERAARWLKTQSADGATPSIPDDAAQFGNEIEAERKSGGYASVNALRKALYYHAKELGIAQFAKRAPKTTPQPRTA